MKIASKLKHRITIEEPVYTSDLLGGFITLWKHVATMWADINPAGGSPRVSSEHIENITGYRIVVRYNAAITTKMRIKFKSKYFAIRSITNVGELGEIMEITASDEVK